MARWLLVLLIPVMALLAFWMSRVPPHAGTGGGLTALQQRQIESVVHDYVLGNGQIIPEAMRRYENRQVAGLLQQARGELETPCHGAVGGNPKGDVTLVVFFDFRCPYCHNAKREVDALIKADPMLRVVYHDFPVLDAPGQPALSRVAAQLALAAAKQNRYEAFHDALFNAPLPMTQESIVSAARRAGLDEARAVADSRSADVSAAIDRNLELGRLLGITGTPSYVIGDQLLVGGNQPARLPSIIADIRARASR